FSSLFSHIYMIYLLNDHPPTKIYSLSLHDALPIFVDMRRRNLVPAAAMPHKTASGFVYDCGEFEEVLDKALILSDWSGFAARRRSEEHTSELQSLAYLVCRLLLEKKNKI